MDVFLSRSLFLRWCSVCIEWQLVYSLLHTYTVELWERAWKRVLVQCLVYFSKQCFILQNAPIQHQYDMNISCGVWLVDMPLEWISKKFKEKCLKLMRFLNWNFFNEPLRISERINPLKIFVFRCKWMNEQKNVESNHPVCNNIEYNCMCVCQCVWEKLFFVISWQFSFIWVNV